MDIDKKQFLEYITNPGALAYQPELQMLREVVRQYPYFQSAHLLLTLGYHQTNSIFFDQTLRKTALYAGDREVLYRLVHHSYKTDLTTTGHSTQKDEELQELDALINQSSQGISTDQLLKEISSNAEAPSESETSSKTTETTESQAPSKSTEGRSFIDWLNQLSKKSASKTSPAKTHEDKISEEKAPQDNPASKAPGHQHSAKGPQSKPDQKAIVDAFLQNPPKLKRPKSEFYDPDEMAQRSVKEDDELVSEPLARIHFQQGNYKKAIQLYEKLSLLYPDKFHYFAQQIELVKKQQKK